MTPNPNFTFLTFKPSTEEGYIVSCDRDDPEATIFRLESGGRSVDLSKSRGAEVLVYMLNDAYKSGYAACKRDLRGWLES